MIRRFLFLITAAFLPTCAFAIDQGYTNFKSSITVHGAVTLPNLTNEDCIGTDVSGNVQAGSCGGSGGGSSVAVELNSVVISSPVRVENFSSGFTASESPTGQANIAVNFSSIASQNDLASYLTKSSASATYFQPANATTTNLPEGSNLYYTTARATSAISGTAPITYSNGVIGLDSSVLSTTTAAATYLSQSSAAATYLSQSSAAATYFQPANATTSNLPEGSNLYFTTARATSSVSANSPLTYNNGVFSAPSSTFTLYGPNIPAAAISSGSLGASVIASSIAANGVGAGTYGSATQVSSVTVGVDGRITSATNITISLTNSNLQSGTYSNVTIPAANVASGSLGSSVIASSIAASAVQDASIVSVSGSKITGTASIPNAAIDGSSVTKQANTFNGASQLVQLNGSSQLPAVSGANLTNLPAANLTGLVPNASIDGSSVTKQGVLLAGSNVTLTPGAGTLTIASSGSGSGVSVYPATSTIYVPAINFTGPTYPLGSVEIPAAGGVCQISNGCVPAGQFETATSSFDYVATVFQAGTTQYWQHNIVLPGNYIAASTFTVKIGMTSTMTMTANWKVDMACISNGGTSDSSWGTAVTISTGSSSGTFLMSQESGAITPSGSCSPGSQLEMRLYRNGDAMGDAYFRRLVLYYEKNKFSAQ